MIYGIGTDLTHTARFELGLERFGGTYAERLLSPIELAEFRASAMPGRFLAKRFAVKEAFAKAAGTGLRPPVTLHNLTLAHDDLGRPMLSFAPVLAQWLSRRGIVAHHVSLSDEGQHVLACVVLERGT